MRRMRRACSSPGLRQRFDEEVREGVALIGAAIQGWDKRKSRKARFRKSEANRKNAAVPIERLKIKIEESGVGNGDAVVKEFNQTKERDEFLAKELIDLETSAASLKDIIAELEKTIDEKFRDGLEAHQRSAQEFFPETFRRRRGVAQDRGAARAKVEGAMISTTKMRMEIEEEEELYAGLSVSVHLPRKKVHGLEVLSGGERALTSIALIFSMSQVNPPPFLILDETDAALDEANSKRYADMIRELGAKVAAHRHHPQPRDHGRGRRTLRRHDGAGRRFETAVGETRRSGTSGEIILFEFVLARTYSRAEACRESG